MHRLAHLLQLLLLFAPKLGLVDTLPRRRHLLLLHLPILPASVQARLRDDPRTDLLLTFDLGYDSLLEQVLPPL